MSQRERLIPVGELVATDFVPVDHQGIDRQLVIDDDRALVQVQPPQPLREVPESIVARMASVFWPYRSGRECRVQRAIIESLQQDVLEVRAAIAARAIWVTYVEQIGLRQYHSAAPLAGLDLDTPRPTPLHRAVGKNLVGVAPPHMVLPDAPIHILTSE